MKKHRPQSVDLWTKPDQQRRAALLAAGWTVCVRGGCELWSHARHHRIFSFDSAVKQHEEDQTK